MSASERQDKTPDIRALIQEIKETNRATMKGVGLL